MSTLKSYATLAQLRTRNQVAASDTTDDLRYLAKLRAATQAIDRFTMRSFQPVTETRKFDWQFAISLSFRSQELLSLTSIIDGSSRAIDPTSITLLGGPNDAYGPYYGFTLDPTKAYMLYLTSKVRAISVTGVWGWHDDYANAWHSSGDVVLDAPMTSSQTTITINNSSSADVWGQSPRFSAGQLIQIESEWLHVIGTTPTVLTVVRGVNGTTAATHAQNTPISVYEAPKDIQEACLRWAAYLLAQDDTEFGKLAVAATGSAVVTAQMLPDIAQLLEPYAKKRVA